MATLADKIGAWRSGPVQRSARDYSGHCTYAFTQCKPPVSSFIAGDESTAIGVCESMAAHWIKFHAFNDSFWDWFMPDGEVSMTRLLYDIMQLQSRGILGDQDAVTEEWLKQNRILRLRSSSLGFASAQKPHGMQQFAGAYENRLQAGRTGVFSPGDLARAMVLDPYKNGCYKKLWLSGKFGQHVMALWVAKDVAFFDANFGEFWFEDKNEFVRWWTKKFWYTSLYNIGLSGEFELRPYAKAHWSGERRG